MKKKYLVKALLAFFLAASGLGCSQNLFDEIADKNSNEAIYFQARQEINGANYTAAITLLESLDPSFIGARERVPVYSSAYAGRCGLDMLSFLDQLQNGAGTLFTILMSSFPGAIHPTHADDCIQAETIMDGIGDETVRNGDENLFMAFVSFAKMGTVLSGLADTDDDGAADGTFDMCDNNDLPEAYVREFGASLAVALLSIGQVGGGFVDGATGDLDAICDGGSGLPGFSDICEKTNPADFEPAEVSALRLAIGTTEIGIDACGGRNFNDCAVFTGGCP